MTLNSDLTCLWKIQTMKRISKGYLERIIPECDCENCHTYNQSSIACQHYISKSHLEYFKRLFERGL